jgi:arylsulfatase A-like enzyme
MPFKNYLLFIILFFLVSCQESDKKNISPIVDPPVVLPPLIEPPVVVPPIVVTPIPQPESRPNVIVIFTDDQGFSDLGVQNILTDVKTPHIDQLAANGVRMTNGYVTAPQCTPSRAGMISGQYQQKFGVDDNRYTPMPLDVATLGEHFQTLNYKTGMTGKWHLNINRLSEEWLAEHYPGLEPTNLNVSKIPLRVKKQFFPNNRGYEDTYFGTINQFWATFNKQGNTLEEKYIQDKSYRIDAVSDASVAFIERNHESPFYLHVAHFGPHVPLSVIEKYLERFPDDTIIRRQYALAMISAIDDGVGKIVAALNKYQLLENTMIIFISDNGAPLGLDMTNSPINNNLEAWNGSMNYPLTGEKGMLTDGGIKVPYIIQWPNKIQRGLVLEQPIISLDATFTALKAAGATSEVLEQLDGVDLLPALTESPLYLEDRPLFWRFWNQSAVRIGNWKYLKVGNTSEYLFNMSSPENSTYNLLYQEPEIAKQLKEALIQWEKGLKRENENLEPNNQELVWYEHYLH